MAHPDIRLTHLQEAINERLPYVLKLYGITNRFGGYLSILDVKTGEWLVKAQLVGRVDDPAKAAKYADFSVEKAERLRDAFLIYRHICSRMSRDPERNRWGGAILCVRDDLIISFSGLPELADEAFVILLAENLPNVNFSDRQPIASFGEPEVNKLLLAA